MSRFNVVREFKRSARVAIGVPTYNGSRRLSWLLTSLENAGGLPRDGNIAFTVLNDGSSRSGEQSALTDLADRYQLNLLEHPQNGGVTQSWNDIVGFVDCEFVVLLNDDVLLTPRWLDHLVYFLENNECGAAGLDLLHIAEEDVPRLLAGEPVAIPASSLNYLSCQAGHLLMTTPTGERPEIAAAAPAVVFGFRKSNLEAVGVFDERLRNSHTEVWFGTLLAERGLLSFVLTDQIWHLLSASFRENSELSCAGDHETFIARWGSDVVPVGPWAETLTTYLEKIAPRKVRWLDSNDTPVEKEIGP